MQNSYPLGIIGLGVMGRSLVLNFQRNDYNPLGYHPKPHLPEGFPMDVTDSIPNFMQHLVKPKIILLMVPAGDTVDSVLSSLMPHLELGDIVIDGGNSYFKDTNRRLLDLDKKGIGYVGMGVSGGEQGALLGPSMMPGGSNFAWNSLRSMFESIAAKAKDGAPCVTWIGPEGAGHYVKMVHNGIEYADMQLIAEVYDLLHRGAGIPNHEIAAIFSDWNNRELDSYLIQITADILRVEDEETGNSLVDMILDTAGQKGTGKWTSQNAYEVGSAIPTINAAVEIRYLSGLKKERNRAAQKFGKAKSYSGDKNNLVITAEKALYASKLTSYAQGFDLLRLASIQYDWDLDLASIARIWRAGCIIRAELLDDISKAYENKQGLVNLMLDDYFKEALLEREEDWRSVIKKGTEIGIPMLAIYDSLAYFDAYRSEILPTNLIQAQRDYFGAHTYERIDREGKFHTDWEQK